MIFTFHSFIKKKKVMQVNTNLRTTHKYIRSVVGER